MSFTIIDFVMQKRSGMTFLIFMHASPPLAKSQKVS